MASLTINSNPYIEYWTGEKWEVLPAEIDSSGKTITWNIPSDWKPCTLVLEDGTEVVGYFIRGAGLPGEDE